jgi:hypothetical protein
MSVASVIVVSFRQCLVLRVFKDKKREEPAPLSNGHVVTVYENGTPGIAKNLFDFR